MTWAEDYEAHLPRLREAQRACAFRGAWTPFVESPSRRLHPAGALENGRTAFDARLGRRFELPDCDAEEWIGQEVSPYTREPLGVTYPRIGVDRLFEQASHAMGEWRLASPNMRVGVCMEVLDRLAGDVFENAFATMHTSGQAFMMAFAGSGANSLDRGLEALAFADLAMWAVPETAVYEREFAGRAVRLEKRYRLMPRGVAVVIT